MKSPLCGLADWLPSLVAAELEEARTLAHQSRETSWTDRMLLELKKLRDPRIIVQNSNERVTGADMDWHFVRHDGRRHLHLAVQAKILHYTTTRVPHRYGELAHPKRSGRQSRQLTNYAKRQLRAGLNTFPLYLFYNPASVWHAGWGCSPGITLAGAYRVRHHLDRARRGTTDNRVPLQAVEFSAARPLMFCLHATFCQPNHAIPSPDEVAKALAAVDTRIGRGTIRGPRPPILAAGALIPRDIELITRVMRDAPSDSAFLENPDFGSPERPRVIFLGPSD
jgi:hypothetical protein